MENRRNFRSSLWASLQKEFLESLASYRLLMIGAVLLFFAIADPAMMKVMPMILKSQLGAVDFSSLIVNTPLGAVQSYLGDLNEIGIFALVLILMGTVSQDRLESTLVLPISMGLDIRGALWAKWLYYSGVIGSFAALGLAISILYSRVLFAGEMPSLLGALQSWAALSVYLSYVVALVIFSSTYTPKPMMGGVLALILIYGGPAILGLFKGIQAYLPSAIMGVVLQLDFGMTRAQVLSLVIGLTLSLGLILISGIRRGI